MQPRPASLAFAVALAAGQLGCGSSDSPSGSASTNGGSCVPGASTQCSCTNGAMGAQICQADGRSLGVCLCSGTASTSGSGGGSGGSTNGGGGGAGGGTVAIGDAYWARAFGGTSGARVLSAAADSTGAAILGGVFSGPVTLGTTNATCPVADEVCGFVVKIEASGKVSWASTFLGADADSDVDQALVAVGPTDEIYVAGAFSGAIDFGQGSVGASGQRFLYVSKYDAAGALSRSLHYQVDAPPARVSASGAVVRANGHLVLEGETEGGIDFGRGAVGPGIYLVDFAPSGVAASSVAFAGTAEDTGGGLPGASTLARTKTGDLRLVGRTVAAADLGCGMLPADVAFVAGLDPTGACLFSTPFTGARLSGIATDALDRSTSIAGVLEGGATLAIGADSLTAIGTSDVLVLHLDADGAGVWGRSAGAALANELALGVAVDATSGDVAITGSADGVLDLGSGAVEGTGQVFAAVFGRDATLRWAGRFGATGAGHAASYAAPGQLVIGGAFVGTMSFSSQVIQANGPMSGFAAKLSVP